MKPVLDVVTIGRSSVDLYGQQVGGRLEDMASFSKAVGGCPANIAIGTARLGLRSGLITRVGDEPMGNFIREQMVREGVATDGIVTDGERLTALVILGVRDENSFPLIFYRDNCADMALCEDDIDEAFVASAGAVVVTGTHFSRANTAAAQKKAIRIAKANGRKVVFDVDYRPNLWGLLGHGAGDARYVRSDQVTEHLRPSSPIATSSSAPRKSCISRAVRRTRFRRSATSGPLRAAPSCASAARWAAWCSRATSRIRSMRA